MAAYVDFTYYSTSYLGVAVAESDFPRLALRASAIIDQLTFGRAATDTTNTAAIKNATCAIAEEIYNFEQSGSVDGIASESIGQNSVTYTEYAGKNQAAMQKYSAAAYLYLAQTGLMFKGFAVDEYSTDAN
jgi:hypothetical protein